MYVLGGGGLVVASLAFDGFLMGWDGGKPKHTYYTRGRVGKMYAYIWGRRSKSTKCTYVHTLWMAPISQTDLINFSYID
jgi:hypothetical protein